MNIFLVFASDDDKKKFEILYDRYKKIMLYKSYNILKDYSLAEDAVSEAFIRVYKNLSKISEIESPMTIAFISTITTNVSLTILNKKNKYANNLDIDEFEKGDGFDLENFVISEESSKIIFEIVDLLKEELRTPFLLKYGYDMSMEEISKVLKISSNNVSVRIFRAKKKLAKLVAERGNIYEL